MEKKNNIGFLFDLDGVLIDSERKYTQIWHDINQEFPTGYDDLEYRIKGTTLSNILSSYFPHPDIQKKVVEILYEKENEMKYEYCPGAFELLEKIKPYKSALVTSSNDVKLKKLWAQIPQLKEYFDVIIDGSRVKKSKPDPEGYLLASNELGIEIRKCVVFEDSLQGIRAGKNAGALVVGISGTLHPEIIAKDSDILLNSLFELNFIELCHILNSRD